MEPSNDEGQHPWLALGKLMRAARISSGVRTDRVPKPNGTGFYSSAYISQVERGLQKVTPELVEHYVLTFGADRNTMGAAFRAADGVPVVSPLSVARQYDIVTDRGMRASSRESSTPLQRPAEDGSLGFALNRYHVEYNLPKAAGAPLEVHEFRDLRALRDDLAEWKMFLRYIGGSPDPDPDIALFGPGLFEVVENQALTDSKEPGRILIRRVVFPSALAKDESIEFTLCRRQEVDFVEKTKSGWQDQRNVTPIVPIDELRIAVRFPVGHRPGYVWQFGAVREELATGEPIAENALQIDRFGRVWFEWKSPIIGLCYGIAWKW